MLLQVARGGHAQAPVVGQAHADQRRIGHVAHAHRAVEAFAGQVHHAVAEVERNRHLRVQPRKRGTSGATWRRPKPAGAVMRRCPLAFTPPSDTLASALATSASRRWQSSRNALPSCVRRDAPRGAHQQLHAQVLFQRVEPPAHDGRRHALGLGGRRQAALGGHRDKGFEGLEFVHAHRLGIRKNPRRPGRRPHRRHQPVLVGVAICWRHGATPSTGIERVYGARHGVRGIVNEDFRRPDPGNQPQPGTGGRTPASALGSTRDKPDLAYCQEIFKVLQAHESSTSSTSAATTRRTPCASSA
jgi:hypothetical protein